MDSLVAREDVRHRLWALRASIERYLLLQKAQMASIRAGTPESAGYTRDRKRLNSEADSQIEAVLTNANNLRRALGSKRLPASVAGQSLGNLDEPIRHVRNIREHWDENRPFWSDGVAIPAGQKYASARWFKANFPHKTPWGSSWSNVEGSVICGIIQLEGLLKVLEQLERLIGQE